MIRTVNQIWLFAGVAPGCEVRKAFVFLNSWKELK